MKMFYAALSLVLIMLTPQCGSAQFYDNHWMMGYNGGSMSEPNDSFGVSILSFYNGELKIENNQEIDLFMQDAAVAISSFSGNLMFFSDGIEIRNFDADLVVNGMFDGEFGDIETIGSQSLLFLPSHETATSNDFSFLRMKYTNDFPRLGAEVLHSRIDAAVNGDLGLLYDKDQRIINAATLANHPNYRLGPIDGSVCDSLGINNLPRAYYRIDRNPEDTLAFHFQDLSFYEPDTWSWTFGDGSMSTDRHPDHTYASPGVYEVCLTVSNDLGSDTDCRMLELGPVAVDDPQALTFTTFPNPVQDVLVFDLGDYYPLNGQFRLYNSAGQLVFFQQVLYSQARMQLTHLPAGIYFYEFWDGGVKLGQGKVVKG